MPAPASQKASSSDASISMRLWKRIGCSLAVVLTSSVMALPASAQLTWGNVGTECRGTQRVDYARLWGLAWPGPDWVSACKQTKASGVSSRSDGKTPSACLQKEGNAVWGEWKYSNDSSCKPTAKWGAVSPYGCVPGEAKRIYAARIWDDQGDAIADCQRTAVSFKDKNGRQMSFAGGQNCHAKIGQGVWSEWQVSDDSCNIPLEWANDRRACNATRPWTSTVSARLWHVPDGQDWEDVCAKTPISSSLKSKYGVTTDLPTRCVPTVLGVDGVWGEWDRPDDGSCGDPRFARYPFAVANRSGRDVFMTAMWLSEEKIVTQEAMWLKAGATSKVNVAGPVTCDLGALEAALQSGGLESGGGTASVLRGIAGQDRDTCLGEHFQILFWNAETNFIGYAAENSAIQIAAYLAVDYVLGKIGWGVIPLPGAKEASDFASKKWLSMRSPDGSLREWGVHGWAPNAPQQKATVVYWGPEFAQDVILDGEADIAGLIPPASRGAVTKYVYEIAVDASGNHSQRKRTCSNDC